MSASTTGKTDRVSTGKLRGAAYPLAIGLVSAALLFCSGGVAAAAGHLNVITIEGSINPASADYLIEAIRSSEADGAAALLIELDTPGGLVSSSQDIIKAMLNSEVPTIVYVTPRGAWAASAGMFVTIAANLAAMTPGSSIGAAHPVSIGGGGGSPTGGDGEGATRDVSMEKAENLLASYVESIAKHRKRNVEWVVDAVRDSVAVDAEQALELGVIDFVVADRGELLALVEGRELEMPGGSVTLKLKGVPIEFIEMTLLQEIFNFLSDPNVAVILLLGGLMGLYVEFNNPGLILPGAAGAVCLVLTGIALQILPFDWVGLILIIAGLGLLVAEIFVTSFGLLFAAGIGCFLLGGTMVFEQPDLSDLSVSFWSVLVPAVLALGLFSGVVVLALGRSLLVKQQSGVDEMIGSVGKVTSALSPQGKVFIRGEYWTSEAPEFIDEGEAVEVTSVEGLSLRVKRSLGSRRV
ncbi:MAG TPA: nodulation protein NfeD [Myxococcales bacterium]|nr:nodulation protein NfeD [Myxococcales bacterium]HIL80739.1 nodulation protein NfeD [Myxococcales bacterium]